MNCPDDLMTLVLKLPHRPRSAVITNSSTLPPAFGTFRSSSRGWADGSTRDARLFSTRCICEANGRACCVRSCARRSFDAATIFMALVICCVDFTARMRRRMSNSDGMVSSYQLSAVGSLRAFSSRFRRRRELVAELLQGLIQVRLDLVGELALLGDRLQQLRPSGVEELEQLDLEVAHALDRHRVEEALVRSVDDDDLFAHRQRLILRLLQHFDQPAATVELIERRLV